MAEDESFAVSSVKVSDMRGIYLCSDDLPNHSLYLEYGDVDHGEMG